MGEITRRELDLELQKDLIFNEDNVSLLPTDIEIEGRTLVNLLGRAGNAIYKQAYRMFLGNIDTTDSVLYNNDKFVLSGTNTGNCILGTFSKDEINKSFVTGRYYIALAEAKLNVGDSCVVAMYGDNAKGNNKSTTVGENRTLYMACMAKDTSYTELAVIGSMEGKRCEFSNYRVYEITQDEFEKIDTDPEYTGDKLAAIYPYVDDVKCVVNPYLECKENLLEGSTWFNGYTSGDGLTAIPTGINAHVISDLITNLEAGKEYTYSLEFDNSLNLVIYWYDGEINGWHGGTHDPVTFIAEVGKVYRALLWNKANEVLSKEVEEKLLLREWRPVLTKGSTPKSYDECHYSRVMLETKLYDGEKITRGNDGSYIKNSEWEEAVIDEKTFPVFHAQGSNGNKRVRIDNLTLPRDQVQSTLVRYDGNIVQTYLGSLEDKTEGLHASLDDSINKNVYLSLPNTLTGWGPDYTPTDNEVKAFFLGWKMYKSITGEGNEDLWNGETDSKYVKKWAKLWNGTGEKLIFTNGSYAIVNGSGTATCPTVINDQGYIPYKLIYKKVTPTTKEVKTHGSLAIKDGVGIIASSGLVLDECVSPYKSGAGYEINPLSPTTNKYGASSSKNRMREILSAKDETLTFLNFAVRNLKTEAPDCMINGGTVNAYIADEISSERILYDYLIYSPDTVTSFKHSLKEVKTVKEFLNKSQEEIVSCFEELAKTKRHLQRAEEELSQRSNPNLLINGDFQVWQRGTSFTWISGAKYCADRFIFVVNTETTVSKTDEGMSIKVPRGAWYCRQILEKPLKAGAYTVSVSVDGKVHSYQLTSTGSTTSVTVMDANSAYCKGAGTTHVINWVKLELGEHATPFVPRSYAEELAMCQRYYEVSEPDTLMSAYVGSSGDLLGYYHFKTPKRVKPTVTVNHSENAGQLWISCNNNYGRKNVTVAYIGDKHVRIQTVEKSLSTHGYAGQLAGQIVADAEIY